MKAKLSKGLIIGLVIVVGGLLIYLAANKLQKTATVTPQVDNNTINQNDNTKPVNYFSTAVDYSGTKDDYQFTITIDSMDNILFSDYANQNVYISLNFDGTVPDNIKQFDYPTYKVPLQNGKIVLSSLSFNRTDDLFSGNSLANLNEFLEGKVSYLNMSIDLFNPEGNILQVYNYILTR